MQHNADHLIDLGAVTEETKGNGGIEGDSLGGKQLVPGISDD